MDRQDDFYRELDQRQRAEKKSQRKKKWEDREKRFWKAFLFTEDGKPKSGLVIYTFFLSFVFLGFYVAGFWLVIEYLTGPLSGLPPFAGNLIQSVLVGLAGAGLSAVLHLLLTDKRMAFGGHIWLALYAIASVITLCIMLGNWEDISAMLMFCAWFVAIPLAIGLLATWLLFRKDYVPPRREQEQPEWKKYIDRR